MKATPAFCLLAFCLLASKAQPQRLSRPLSVPTNQSVTMLKIWSDWMPNSGYAPLQARYASLEANTITLELRNTGATTLEGDFTANECPDNRKDASGWKQAILEPGQSIKLSFASGGCGAGFHWWCQNLYVWSEWLPLNPDDYLAARWVKRGANLSLQVTNRSDHSIRADFTANFCEPNFKSINGWQAVSLSAGETKTLSFHDNSPGHCHDGFRIWYRNLRGPQQIDLGTELIPAGH